MSLHDAHSLDVQAIRKEHHRTHTGSQQSVGSGNTAITKIDVTEEEAAFGVAMDRYKSVNNRPFPTYSEVLAVAVALGYRRVADSAPATKIQPANETIGFRVLRRGKR